MTIKERINRVICKATVREEYKMSVHRLLTQPKDTWVDEIMVWYYEGHTIVTERSRYTTWILDRFHCRKYSTHSSYFSSMINLKVPCYADLLKAIETWDVHSIYRAGAKKTVTHNKLPGWKDRVVKELLEEVYEKV